jgi:hypothetical protein
MTSLPLQRPQSLTSCYSNNAGFGLTGCSNGTTRTSPCRTCVTNWRNVRIGGT